MLERCDTEGDVYAAILEEFDQPPSPGQDPVMHLARCVIALLRLIKDRGKGIGRAVTNGLLLALALFRPSRELECGGSNRNTPRNQDRSWIHKAMSIELQGK